MITWDADLEKSLKTGFIDKTYPYSGQFLPQLLVNDSKRGKKVLNALLKGLNTCEEFWFSVAFVTTGGVASIIETLVDLERRGVKGKILVSQYLNFTQPEALKRLLQFKNIELKISTQGSFHSKGYLFRRGAFYDLVIGSSNLTATALSSNAEWNLKVSAKKESYLIQKALDEFSAEFKKAISVDQKFIDSYAEIFQFQLKQSRRIQTEVELQTDVKVVPNSMQIEALKNLENLRSVGKTKALLISATGTGKTYLSAFDVKTVNPKRVLFVVHRLNIAKAALKTFKSVFGHSKSMGLYSGNQRDLDADFIFSTVQTIAKTEHLNQFSKDHFDYIIVDETHRAGAESYAQLLNYFSPTFLLGMTATPERSDGEDIFKLFDYNIAYEIRLHRALEEEMLSPFHYYGVTDLTINGNTVDDNTQFNALVSEERVDRILEKAKLYGCDNGRVRGLVFCSRTEVCEELSKAFNQKGYKTVALVGKNSEEERSEAIRKLESDSYELDYIFTVDIFNEGIDIPKVNQIIMLRPTQSAIIFVQQLGRGLRKVSDKEYLTVIDFIGNYKNNFLVPIALYGDNSYNKDTLRKLLANGSAYIPGCSTINFDRIAKEKIFESLNTANLQVLKDLKTDFNLLKFRLGRTPMMMDFMEQKARDPFAFVTYSKSYYNFVQKVESSIADTISKRQIELLELFALEINNAKRVEESVLLRFLIEKSEISVSEFVDAVQSEFGFKPSDETIASCVQNLNFKFVRKDAQIVRLDDDVFSAADELVNSLESDTFKKYLLDNTNYSIESFKQKLEKGPFVNGFIRYQKYGRKDVCRILNWNEDISSTVYGYRTQNKKTPCFVTYHKSDSVSDSTNYNDHFIDQQTFAWQSRSKRRIQSDEIKTVIASERILLFVKKEDAEGTDFYFVGDVQIVDGSISQQKMPKSNEDVVHFNFSIDEPVDDSLFEYLTAEEIEDVNVSETAEVSKSLPFRVLSSNEAKPFENCIPLFDLKVAAGGFSELQEGAEVQWIQPHDTIRYSNNFFVVKVVGESMNQSIPNGAYCLFQKDLGGSRQGKIVLAHHASFVDREFGFGYTVKRYSSEKVVSEEGWSHTAITLLPDSSDASFQPINLSPDELSSLQIHGIFVKVL